MNPHGRPGLRWLYLLVAAVGAILGWWWIQGSRATIGICETECERLGDGQVAVAVIAVVAWICAFTCASRGWMAQFTALLIVSLVAGAAWLAIVAG